MIQKSRDAYSFRPIHPALSSFSFLGAPFLDLARACSTFRYSHICSLWYICFSAFRSLLQASFHLHFRSFLELRRSSDLPDLQHFVLELPRPLCQSSTRFCDPSAFVNLAQPPRSSDLFDLFGLFVDFPMPAHHDSTGEPPCQIDFHYEKGKLGLELRRRSGQEVDDQKPN
jgi:hypothetical protein